MILYSKFDDGEQRIVDLNTGLVFILNSDKSRMTAYSIHARGENIDEYFSIKTIAEGCETPEQMFERIKKWRE